MIVFSCSVSYNQIVLLLKFLVLIIDNGSMNLVSLPKYLSNGHSWSSVDLYSTGNMDYQGQILEFSILTWIQAT